jgi:hypothetical protein
MPFLSAPSSFQIKPQLASKSSPMGEKSSNLVTLIVTAISGTSQVEMRIPEKQ